MIMKINNCIQEPRPSPFCAQRYVIYEMTHPTLAIRHIPAILQIMMTVEETRVYFCEMARTMLKPKAERSSGKPGQISLDEALVTELEDFLKNQITQRTEFVDLVINLSVLAFSQLQPIDSHDDSGTATPWLSPRTLDKIFPDFVKVLSEEETGKLQSALMQMERNSSTLHAKKPIVASDSRKGTSSIDPEKTAARIYTYVNTVHHLQRTLQAMNST
jgi:hypothetical protein